MRKLTVVLIGVVLYAQSPQTNQAQRSLEPPVTQSDTPKFMLSEVEALNLKILELRRELLQCHVAPEQQALSNDLQTYIGKTIKDHGNPKGVQFDTQTFQFKVVPVPPSQPSGTQH